MDKLVQLESLLVRDLRALVTLAERRHFAQAAEELGISQPSLSAIVKRIEVIFGATLFARTSRRFSVTPEGEVVLRQVRAVLEELTRLSTVLDSGREPLTGRFRLGVIPTLGPYYIPRFLEALNARYPALELVLIEAKTEHLIAQLQGRELDAALLALPMEAPDLEPKALFREPFVLAVPEGHPLAERPEVNARELDVRELLLLEQGNCLSDQTLDACGARGPGEGRAIHATSLETLRYMVATRIGIAILPRLAVSEPETRRLGLRYVPFAAPEPSRVVGLVSRRHSTRGRDVGALAESLQGHLPDELTAV